MCVCVCVRGRVRVCTRALLPFLCALENSANWEKAEFMGFCHTTVGLYEICLSVVFHFFLSQSPFPF